MSHPRAALVGVDSDRQLFALAARQAGLVTVHQARRLGLSDRQLRTRVDNGVLDRLSSVVLRVSGSPRSADQAVLAAVWSCGPGAVASHRTAAWLHRFDDALRPSSVDVTVLRPARGNRSIARVHETRDLTDADRDRRGLIPVTTPARTLFDLAATRPLRELEVALDGALRDGLVSRPEMLWHLDRLSGSGRRGCRKLAALLGTDRTGADRCESWLESACLRLFRRSDLPEPQVQRVEHDPTGDVLRVDFAFADGRLAVEVSGHATHATRRQRQADAERRSELALRGIQHLEFTYEDVTERSEYVVRRVGQLLDHLRVPPALNDTGARILPAEAT